LSLPQGSKAFCFSSLLSRSASSGWWLLSHHVPCSDLRVNHKPYRTESAKLNSLAYRSTPYQRAHVRAKLRMFDITPPNNRIYHPATRFALVWAMRVPKPYPRKLLRSVGRIGADVLEATGTARIGALRTSSIRTQPVIACGNGRQEDRHHENGSDTHHAVLAGVLDFLVFRPMYVCPASTPVRRGST